jgi:hypothetical protein
MILSTNHEQQIFLHLERQWYNALQIKLQLEYFSTSVLLVLEECLNCRACDSVHALLPTAQGLLFLFILSLSSPLLTGKSTQIQSKAILKLTYQFSFLRYSTLKYLSSVVVLKICKDDLLLSLRTILTSIFRHNWLTKREFDKCVHEMESKGTEVIICLKSRY